MSLASYICMERQIPEQYLNLDEKDETVPLYIGPCFADEDCLYEVKTKHFHKWYVYEISSHWASRSLNLLIPKLHWNRKKSCVICLRS